ncbi:hypothetical protein V6Z11_A03G097800 [Gossypium hirsutum]
MSSSSFQLVFIFCFSILLLLIMPTSMQTVSAATTNKASAKTYKKFIKSACSTTYPKVCYKALSPSASAIKTDTNKLCNIAFPSEKEITHDCAETTGEAIDELEKSLKTLANLQGSDHKADEMNDLKTWVSAILTDEYTCTDEFDGQKVSKAVKNTINKSVLYLAQLTSNCLALFNLLDY